MKKIKLISAVMMLFFLSSNGIAQQWKVYYSLDLDNNNGGIRPDIRYYDKYIVGNFSGGENDNLLSMNGIRTVLFDIDFTFSRPGDKIKMNKLWENNTGYMGGWQKHDGDQYIVGDFNGDGKDELLCFGESNHYANIVGYSTQRGFYNIWSNNGNTFLLGWKLDVANDKYFVGDFSGRGRDELLCFGKNGWAYLMYFNGSSWVHLWSNGGDGKICTMTVASTTSRFVSGKYLQNTKDELLGLCGSGWATIIRYNPTRKDWDWMWSQYGTSSFGGWNVPVESHDVVLSGNFDRSRGYDEIFFVRDREQYNNNSDPLRLVGYNTSSRDFESFWFNTGYLLNNYGEAIQTTLNHFLRFRIKGKDYLFRSWFHDRFVKHHVVYLRFLEFANPLNTASVSRVPLNGLSDENKYRLYPNPAMDNAVIERYSAENQGFYEVYDILGVQLLHGVIPVAQLSEKINVKDLKPGTYIVRITDGDKEFIEKIIVN